MHALAGQAYPLSRFEVVVVDDGSADPVSRAEWPLAAVRVCRQARAGSYAARNTGIARSRGDVLAFTDADCVPEPDWLRRACAALDRHPEWGAIGGRVVILDSGPASTPAERYERRYAFPQESYIEHDNFGVTANLVVRRSAIDHVGTFDGRLHSGGDWEWGQRARAAGVVIAYAHDVVVGHPARTTLASLLHKQRRVTQGTAALIRARLYPRDRELALLRGSMVPPVFDLLGILRDPRAGELHQRPAVAGIRMLLWAHRLWLLVAARARPDRHAGAQDV
jgi:glycosyltransferase involved in cell wall biosynthesis